MDKMEHINFWWHFYIFVAMVITLSIFVYGWPAVQFMGVLALWTMILYLL